MVYCDPASKEDILGRTKTRLEWWDEHLKDPIVALEKSLKVLREPQLRLATGSKRLVESRLDCNGLELRGYRDFCKRCGRRAVLGRRLVLFGLVG